MTNLCQAGLAAATLSAALTGILITHAGAALREGGLEAIAALFSTFLVFALNQLVPGLDVFVVIMSSLIVLIPGLGLTIAVTELSTDHLASGSARLSGALITLLKLSLGVLIGTVIVGRFRVSPSSIFSCLPSSGQTLGLCADLPHFPARDCFRSGNYHL